jgi:hypothetical protein|tara:strand:+ start:332 stop:607 length:276 start_codon:yes stop_codon:yes gene_type:complete
MKKTCPHCGKEKKNLGAHLRFCKKKIISDVIEDKLPSIVEDDYIKEKPLSSLVSDMKKLLHQYQTEFRITTFEMGGTIKEVEIVARIQLRR